ncbi:MAG: hypothetical protein LBP33_05425, partial [Candidatus Adiutrix sp.]|nr:hypothetical protein [Candidatus Adiutrix sp.]
ILVGRLDEDLDNFGLATLGWMPENNPVFTVVSPFDDASPTDAIRYVNQWDNGFSIAAQYAKVNNNTDEPEGGGQPAGVMSDEDWDRFMVEAAYQWDGGGLSLGLRYDRDATDFSTARGLAVAFGNPNAPGPGTADSGFFVNPAIRHSWENGFSVNFEALLGWGSADRARPVGANWEDIKAEGYAAYLDFDYNYGPGNVNLAGWYSSGTDLDNEIFTPGAKSKSLIGMGGNFIPLLVAYNDGALGQGRNGLDFGNDNAVSVANNAFWNFILGSWTGSGLGIDVGSGAAYTNYVTSNGGGFLNLSGGSTSIAMWASTNGTAPTVDKLLRTNPNGVGFQRVFSFNNDTEANHWAIAVSGNHALTDDIALHYAVAYLSLNQPSYRVASSALWNGQNAAAANRYSFTNYGYTEQDQDLGWEVDLGFSFQLLDNLQLTTAFGYMFNGDAFKTLRGYTLSATETTAGSGQFQVNSVWEEPDDTYTWLNTLTFSF